jgi:hypothetical protein
MGEPPSHQRIAALGSEIGFSQISRRIDVVELGGLDQRVEDGPTLVLCSDSEP